MEKTVLTIRRKIILPIIVLVLAVFGLFALAACNDEEMITENDIIKRGYDVLVVYDFNGGAVNSTQNSATIRVMNGSHIPEPGSEYNAEFKSPSRNGYSLKGFYLAERDEDGNVIYVKDETAGKDESSAGEENSDEANGDEKAEDNVVMRPKASDVEWNFATDVATEDVMLVAVWWDNFKIDLRCDDLNSIVDVPREKNGDPQNVTSRSMRVSGTTILHYYADSAMTKEITASEDDNNVFVFERESFESAADGLTFTVWCDYLEGVYQIVSSEADFKSLVFGDSPNIYLTRTLNLENVATNIPTDYSGTWLGNGHTISNWTVSKTLNGINYDGGLFNTLKSGASISNITFDNLNVDITLSNARAQEYNVGILAGKVQDGATVSNVTVTGSIAYKLPIGLNDDKVTFDKTSLFGSVVSGASITNSSVEDITVIGSTAIRTADNAYSVYVRFTQTEDSFEYGECYALATHNSDTNTDTRVSESLKYDEAADEYTCTVSRVNYTVKLITDGENISVTVTKS